MKKFLKSLGVFASVSGSIAASGATYNISVEKSGFVPSSIDAKAGEDVTLVVTRKTDSTCATSIQVPSKKLSYELPRDKPVTVKLGKLERGQVDFGCGMNMMIGGVVTAK